MRPVPRVAAPWQLLLCVVLVFAAIAAAAALYRPLIFDEAEFRLVAAGISRHGVPVSLAGEDAFLRSDVAHGAYLGLWHPPLYTYLLAVSYALGGSVSDASTRAVGTLANAMTLLLAALLALRAVGGGLNESPERAVAPWLAALLLAANPFFVQGALYADIDTALLPLLTLAWCGAVWTAELRSPLRPAVWAGLIALSTLLFWAKLTTPPICFAALGAWFVVQREWPAFRRLVVIGAAAGVLFAITWLAYAWSTHVPWDFFVRYTFINKAGQYARVHLDAARIVTSSARTVLWLTPSLALLTLLGATAAMRAGRAGALGLSAMSWSLAGVITVAYSVWYGAEVTKYIVPVVPLLALAAGVALAPEASTWTRPKLAYIALAALAAAVWHAGITGDMFTVPPTGVRIQASRDLMQLWHDPRLRTWLCLPMPVLILPVIFRLAGTQAWRSAFVQGALAATIGLGISQHAMSAATPYSPLTFRPQPDLLRAADTLRMRCHESIAVAQKEIVVRLDASRCRAISTDGGPGAIVNEDSLASRVDSDPRIRWVLQSASYPMYPPTGLLQAVLARRFAPATAIGDYRLFERQR